MANPDLTLSRRDFLKMLAAGGTAYALRQLGPFAKIFETDSAPPATTQLPNFASTKFNAHASEDHVELFSSALAMGHLTDNKRVVFNRYPDGATYMAGPFTPEQSLWPIYRGARIVRQNGKNELRVPVTQPDNNDRYDEIDIRYFNFIDGDPVGEVPVHNNSWIGIGGNWPTEAFPAVEGLGVGFIRINRSNPYYLESLAEAKRRSMKTIFTYDLDFAKMMNKPGGLNETANRMQRELMNVTNLYGPSMIQISNEPDLNYIPPQMYAQLFAFATHALEGSAFVPKLLAASIRPSYLEDYLKELLQFKVIPWGHDIHAYQNPQAIGDVHGETLRVFKKYPQFHRDHLIVLEWGITPKENGGDKSHIIDGLNVALSRSLPICLHQFLNNNPGDDGDYGVGNFSDNKTLLGPDGFLFKQFIKETPRPQQPNDWF